MAPNERLAALSAAGVSAAGGGTGGRTVTA